MIGPVQLVIWSVVRLLLAAVYWTLPFVLIVVPTTSALTRDRHDDLQATPRRSPLLARSVTKTSPRSWRRQRRFSPTTRAASDD